MVPNPSKTVEPRERVTPREGTLKEACPYYRFGVTTLQSKPDLASRRPIARLKEWCQHPKSKNDWITDKVPCGGVTERCAIPPEKR